MNTPCASVRRWQSLEAEMSGTGGIIQSRQDDCLATPADEQGTKIRSRLSNVDCFPVQWREQL